MYPDDAQAAYGQAGHRDAATRRDATRRTPAPRPPQPQAVLDRRDLRGVSDCPTVRCAIGVAVRPSARSARNDPDAADGAQREHRPCPLLPPVSRLPVGYPAGRHCHHGEPPPRPRWTSPPAACPTHDPHTATRISTDRHLATHAPFRNSRAPTERHGPAMREKGGTTWDTNEAAISVSAGHGLDRLVRPKGLEPLTF